VRDGRHRSAAITIPAGTTVEDNVPDDMSMVIETPKGLVILMGCGHAGIINTLEFVQQQFAGKPIHAIIGGAHLIDTKDDQLDWTANS
jgi:7,8-dihydropterin-6-yl-methyl-4-(beta-D-ribofuranosyl)aminobenzene 5'-phosphate synthase